MKILHVCPLYYPAVGGVESVFRAVSEGMAKRREDVTVFTTTGRSLNAFLNPTVKPLTAGEDIINGVRVKRFPYQRISRLVARTFTHGWSMLHLPNRDSLNAWSALPWVTDLSSEITRFKPDIVLAGHFLTRVVLDACDAKKSAGFPLVFHTALHLDIGVDIPREAIELLKVGDAIWVNTSYEKDFLVSKGIEGSKILELGVGVNPDEFWNANGNRIKEKYEICNHPVVLFVGRKEKDKGVRTVVDAMEQVWRKIPEVRLILAGAFARHSERGFLDKAMGKYGKSIISIDAFKDEEKKDLYDACDIFVLPSRIESFGIAYLEAWISGKPVIGADIGSTRSIIDDGEDGYLVGFEDADTLGERIIYLLDHPDVRTKIGTRGREKVLRMYTWDHITEKLLNTYRSLVQT